MATLTPAINILSCKNSYTIYENEVICKISDGELNMSQNPTLTTDTSGSLRDFATGSDFNPYTTTIGLYNDANELLLIGKLGQPTPISPNTDTTFVIRYDQ